MTLKTRLSTPSPSPARRIMLSTKNFSHVVLYLRQMYQILSDSGQGMIAIPRQKRECKISYGNILGIRKNYIFGI